MAPKHRLDKRFPQRYVRAMRTRILAVALGVMVVGGCGRSGRPNANARDDKSQVDLTQKVTVDRNPQDKSVAGFEQQWRQLISPSAELARPVVDAKSPGEARRWQPQATSECVFSADAGGAVPRVTLTWSEGPQRPRFDLAIVHDGFARNEYSSLIPGTADRFLLPSTSALVKKEEAVLLTGPGLFAMAEYRVESVRDPAKTGPTATHTLVLRNLSPGLTYTMRVDRASGETWTEEGRTVFLTPVCPRG
jgi:hypothetical protein